MSLEFMVSISFLRPDHLFRPARTCFLFLSCLAINLANNFPIIDALIRSQNLIQAQAYLSRIQESSSDRQLYQGLLTFYMGEKEAALDLMRSSFPKASTAIQWRVKEHLSTYFQANQTNPEVFFEIIKILFGENIPEGAWKEEWARYLFDTKKYDKIIKIGTTLDSPGMMTWVYKAFKATNKEKQFFLVAKNKEFSSPPLIKEYMRLMLESGLKDDAMQYFESMRHRQDPWIADLFILVGTELDQPDLLVQGYLQKIALAPNVFDHHRSLSAVYFQLKKDQEAESVLFEYLKKFPHKYQGAREIAEVLVDHGRLARLLQFILEIRRQLNDSLALHDLALYSYSISKDYDNFFKELFLLDSRISGEIWAQKIVDSFHSDEVSQAYIFFRKIHEARIGIVLPVLFHIIRKLENPRDSWIDLEIESMSNSNRLTMAELAREYSIPALTIRILAKEHASWDDSLQIKEIKLLGNAYASMGKCKNGNMFLEKILPEFRNLEDNLNLTKCAYLRSESRRKLPGYFDKLTSKATWESIPEKSKTQILQQILEVLTFQEKYEQVDEINRKYQGLISRESQDYLSILREIFTEGESGFEKIPAFLSNRIGSTDFPKVQEIYMLYLDLKGAMKEPFFEHFITALRYAYLGDPAQLSHSMLEIQKNMSGHWAEAQFQSHLAYLSCVYHRLKVDLSQNIEERKIALEQWEKQAFKLFEDFPDCLYTPRVVGELVSSLEEEGKGKEKLDVIRKYLLHSGSNLLAQRLRSSML